MDTATLLILFQSGRALTGLVNLSSSYCNLLMGPRYGKIPTSNKALKYQHKRAKMATSDTKMGQN